MNRTTDPLNKRIVVRLTNRDHRKLVAYCKQNKTTKSIFTRTVLMQHLDDNSQSP